jgi:RimJ/RimL family protein N-acetyltransferase
VPAMDAAGSDLDVVRTARFLLRPPREADRDRFVEFSCNEDFMVFYPGVLTEDEARDRFDHMVAVCQAISSPQAAGGRAVLRARRGLYRRRLHRFRGQDLAGMAISAHVGVQGLGYATEAARLRWPRLARRMRVNCWQSSPRRTSPRATSAASSDHLL